MNLRERACSMPVEIDCEVFSVKGYSDCEKFVRRAIGRFFAQQIETTKCSKTDDGRLYFRFYGTVSSPKMAGKIQRQLKDKGTIESYSC